MANENEMHIKKTETGFKIALIFLKTLQDYYTSKTMNFKSKYVKLEKKNRKKTRL